MSTSAHGAGKLPIVRQAVVIFVSVGLVPVMVSVELAAGVVPEVVTVSVDVPVLPVIVLGLKLAVAPVGNPVTVSATSPVSQG